MRTPTDRRLDMSGAWMAAMRQGDFASAWQISDAVLAQRQKDGPSWDLPRHHQWLWDGRPLAKHQRLLVRCYHGLGDTIQFARFLPRLAETCREVTVWAQPSLMPLLGRMDTPLSLLALHDGTPEIHGDVDIEIMELAHALRTTLDSLPQTVPYFNVRPEPRRSLQLSVGLVAQAGDWDPRRSIPPELLATVGETPAIRTFSLQLGATVPGAADLSSPNILTLAARLRSLDLVITVDTMAAHLAGALGVPTWTLLTADADWRWMEDRDDSPWYPTMRLFRQPRPGDWPTVVERVRAALAALAG